MKTFSDTAITKQEVDMAAQSTRSLINAVDEKQTKQIKQLRIWLAVSFAVNAVLTLALHFG